MIPESLATFYALLALVAPGLMFQVVSERSRPSSEQSAFREVSVVATSSLIFTTTSVLILGAFSRIRPSWFVDLPKWVSDGSVYASNNLWVVAKSVGLEVGIAVGLAALAAWILGKRSTASKAPIAKTSVWYQALKADKPEDKASWVLAELLDGTRVWGYVHYFTLEDCGNDRDISFKGPGLTVQRGGKKSRPVREDYYKYFVVSAGQVRFLKVAHEKKKS